MDGEIIELDTKCWFMGMWTENIFSVLVGPKGALQQLRKLCTLALLT